MAKLGIAMAGASATGFNPRTLALLQQAEHLGYDSAWVPEVSAPDALVGLTYYSLNTSRIALGSGVLPIQIRTPAVMANAFLTLNELSGGRTIAGLGVSSPVIVERWHGASYRKPVTAMRECVLIMRELFDNGRAKFEGSIYRCDIRLGIRRTQPRPPIFLAALNPPMLRLVGELADGVLLNYSPPEAMAEKIAIIRQSALAAGRKPEAVELGVYIRMCVTDQPAEAIKSFKRELATYAFVDSYRQMFTDYGLGEELAEVRRLWQAGKRDQAHEAISDASAERIGCFGPVDKCRQVVAQFRQAGIEHPVVFPIGPDILSNFSVTTKALAGA